MARPAFNFVDAHEKALAEISEITGREDVYLYTNAPTPTSERFVFQSWVTAAPNVQEVCLSRYAAAANVAALLLWCRTNPDTACAAAGTD